MSKPSARKLKDDVIVKTSGPSRKAPPNLANAFSLSNLNDEVVIIDFVDAEANSETVFTSVALTKAMATHLVERLQKTLIRMGNVNESAQSDQ